MILLFEMNCKPIISKNINRHFKIYEKIKIHRVQCCLANKTLPKTGKVLRLRTLTCENELVYGYVIDEFRDMKKGRNFTPFSLFLADSMRPQLNTLYLAMITYRIRLPTNRMLNSHPIF